MDASGLDFETLTLEWLKVGLTQRVSAEFADTVSVETWRDALLHQIALAITAHVLAERLPPARVIERREFAFEVPASPWQQLKATHAGSWWLGWLVKRHPVVTVTHRFVGELSVDLSRFWTFPQSRVPRGRFGDPYRALIVSATPSWDDEAAFNRHEEGGDR